MQLLEKALVVEFLDELHSNQRADVLNLSACEYENLVETHAHAHAYSLLDGTKTNSFNLSRKFNIVSFGKGAQVIKSSLLFDAIGNKNCHYLMIDFTLEDNKKYCLGCDQHTSYSDERFVSMSAIIRFANSCQLSITDAIPFGAFLVGHNFNELFNRISGGKDFFERLISWTDKDQDLLLLTHVLETNIFRKLPLGCSKRTLIIFEKNNPQWRVNNDKFFQRYDLKNSIFFSSDLHKICSAFDIQLNKLSFLQSVFSTAKNKYLVYLLYDLVNRCVPNVPWDLVFTKDQCDLLSEMVLLKKIDKDVFDISYQWASTDISYSGVNLGVVNQYYLNKILMLQTLRPFKQLK